MQSAHEITTAIWQEEPAKDSAGLVTETARCHGYDVYNNLLKTHTWMEFVYLLFRAELPTPGQLRVLNTLGVALANPGPREPSVIAAMSSGVVRTPPATWLLAALSTGAGRHGGARDVRECMDALQRKGLNLAAWASDLTAREADSIWPAADHPAGWASDGPLVGPLPTQLLRQLLVVADEVSLSMPASQWLQANWDWLSDAGKAQGWAVSFPLVAACALTDLGFTKEEGELMYLLLRLPGAAAHALEQSQKSFIQYPFPPLEHAVAASLKEAA